MSNFEHNELMREFEIAVAKTEEVGFERDTFTSVEYARARNFGERKARKHIHMGIEQGMIEPIFTPRKTVHGVIMKVAAYRIIRIGEKDDAEADAPA